MHREEPGRGGDRSWDFYQMAIGFLSDGNRKELMCLLCRSGRRPFGGGGAFLGKITSGDPRGRSRPATSPGSLLGMKDVFSLETSPVGWTRGEWPWPAA